MKIITISLRQRKKSGIFALHLSFCVSVAAISAFLFFCFPQQSESQENNSIDQNREYSKDAQHVSENVVLQDSPDHDGSVEHSSIPPVNEKIANNRGALVELFSNAHNSRVFLGRGCIINGAGFVLTNYHCVLSPKDISIRFEDGSMYPIEKLYFYDVSYDVCILKIGAAGPKWIMLGDSNTLRIGQKVYFAKGPFDLKTEFGSSTISEIKYFNNLRWLVFNAAIPSRNNGTPLLNAKGEVVGIVSFIRDDGKCFAFAINQIAGFIRDPNQVTSTASEDEAASKISKSMIEGYKQSLFGNFERAMNEYNKVLQLAPMSAHAFNNLGNVYHELGLHDQAILYFKKALQLEPDLGEVYFNMGNTYLSLGQNFQAINAYEKAIQINDKLVVAYYNLGSIYHTLGKNQQAISYYEKTISLDPYFPEVYYNLGNVYNAQGQYAQAVSNFENAIKMNPNNSFAYMNLALAYCNLKLYDDARSNFFRAKRLFENQKDVQNVSVINDYLKKFPQ